MDNALYTFTNIGLLIFKISGHNTDFFLILGLARACDSLKVLTNLSFRGSYSKRKDDVLVPLCSGTAEHFFHWGLGIGGGGGEVNSRRLPSAWAREG